MPITKNISLIVFVSLSLATIVRSNNVITEKGVSVAEWDQLKLIRFCAIQEHTTLFIAATPERLENSFDYQIEVRADFAFFELKILPELFAEIKDIESGQPVDCRYALIGISKNGNRLFSIYLDGLSDRGFSDKKAIVAPHALKEWLKKNFPSPLGLSSAKK